MYWEKLCIYAQEKKTTYGTGENICDVQSFSFQDIQTAHTTQQQQNNQKMPEDLNGHFSKADRWPTGT